MKPTTDEIIKIKTPQLREDILDVLKLRFSPRVFLEEKINDEDIKKFFEAARISPSSSNRQPWFFYFSKNGSENYMKIINSLSPDNSWAKNAPLLIVGCFIGEDEKGPNKYAQYDLGQSVMSIVIQVNSIGYYCRQMGGFDKSKMAVNLNIMPPIFPWVVIAVGKIGDYQKADPALIEKDNRVRIRKADVAKEI